MALALPELLKNVFNFLAKDNALYPTLLVSRLWSRCTGPILWGRIELIGEKQQEKFIKMIRINSRPIFRHSVQCLIITHHSYLSNEIIEKIVEVFPNIIHLDFERSTGFDDTALIKISQVYPNLIHLNVSNNGGLTDHSITKIAKKCDKLQFLDIGFSGDITDKSFCEITRSCNRLKHLGISSSWIHVTDSIIYEIARSLPNLQSLDISSCSRLTDTAIHTLTDSYPNLKSLKLAHCDGISDIAIRKIAQFHCLEHLNLYGMSALTDKSMRIIARSCPNIQYLNLQSCNVTDGAIEEIALSCHNLKHLDLYGVRQIISNLSISKIAKMCPNIIYLDLGYAPSISCTTLKIIADHLHALEYLGLKNCYRISQKIIDTLFPDLEIGGYYSLPLGR